MQSDYVRWIDLIHWAAHTKRPDDNDSIKLLLALWTDAMRRAEPKEPSCPQPNPTTARSASDPVPATSSLNHTRAGGASSAASSSEGLSEPPSPRPSTAPDDGFEKAARDWEEASRRNAEPCESWDARSRACGMLAQSGDALLAAARVEIAAERERHASLQARCFEGFHSASYGVFDALRAAEVALAAERALVRTAEALLLKAAQESCGPSAEECCAQGEQRTVHNALWAFLTRRASPGVPS